MKLIIGLGNPGRRYEKTRHNVGWLVLDALTEAQKLKVKSQNYNLKFKINKKLHSSLVHLLSGSLVLAKPTTFMNQSGVAVSALAAYYKVPAAAIYVVHDDLDLRLGEYKTQLGKGPREHKGILSIDEALGTKDYWRVRVGIDNRKSKVKGQKSKINGEDYVLQEFTRQERVIIDEVVQRVVGEFEF